MKRTLILVGIISLFFVTNIFGQLTFPRASNRQETTQTVGDAKISIIYHRPNVKDRTGKIYGCTTDKVIQVGNNTGACLVPNGQVWRAGANENTLIEFSTDVTINGQPLPAGKYSFFAIPQNNEWTLIFNKVTADWGSFQYKEDQDALRVKAVPVKLTTPRETFGFDFENVVDNSTQIVLSWESLAVPFTVNVGNINARVVNKIRDAIKNRKPEDATPLNQGAGFVLSNKLTAHYTEALGWLDESIKVKETFGNLNTKARLLAESGKKAEAISTAEKALQVGKASTPPANAGAMSGLENEIKKWKSN